MNICILGWYGTETLGDRAILDGILIVFSKAFGDFHASIGSLIPFFTQRTLLEDGSILHENAPGMILEYFDVKNEYALHNEIEKADIVLMGGGPLMDLDELRIIAYAFKLAKKHEKKTMIFGCGLGPLYNKVNLNTVRKLIAYTDMVIFRDEMSARLAKMLFGSGDYYHSFDPAILSVGNYLVKGKNSREHSIAINLRDFPVSVYGNQNKTSIGIFRNMIEVLSLKFEEIKLVPMHTFYVGGDDRQYFSKLLLGSKIDNVYALHEPQNLYELYDTYRNAYACIGMRYHSVLMQTLLNGNNFIIDYTESGTGKTSGFLGMINGNDFYERRYTNIQQDFDLHVQQMIDILEMDERFCYKSEIFSDTLSYYLSCIKNTIG